jgi:hypothetical protein
MSSDGGYVAIKGFCYQFDKTIIEIFSQSSDVQVEQLQDLGFDDYLIQVKHHDTNYNDSQQKAKKKKPILALIEQFQNNPSRNYVLYIYLKGIPPCKNTLHLKELDNILGKDVASIDKKIREAFIKNFTLIHAEDFQAQHTQVIRLITTAYGKKNDEAEIYYAMISTYLLRLVMNNPTPHIAQRITNRKEIDSLIRGNRDIIFKSNYAEFLGIDKYNKSLHKFYFPSNLNRDAFERFFIIEVAATSLIEDMKELVLHIKRQWSKNGRQSIPDGDRFVPYIYLRGIDGATLATLKKQLNLEGFKIKDGYDYKDADFNVHSIVEKPTFANKIHFRLINDDSSLMEIIEQPSKTKELYQFYTTSPVNLVVKNIRHIQIEVNNSQQIIKIV